VKPQLPSADTSTEDLRNSLWPTAAALPTASTAKRKQMSASVAMASSGIESQQTVASDHNKASAQAPSAAEFDDMVAQYLRAQAAEDRLHHYEQSNGGDAMDLNDYVYDVYRAVPMHSGQQYQQQPMAVSSGFADFSAIVHDAFGDDDDELWVPDAGDDGVESQSDSEDSNRMDQDNFEYPDEEDEIPDHQPGRSKGHRMRGLGDGDGDDDDDGSDNEPDTHAYDSDLDHESEEPARESIFTMPFAGTSRVKQLRRR